MTRLFAGLAGVGMVAALFAGEPSIETCFRSHLNAERSSRGIRTVGDDSRVTKVARDHSARMADRGEIYHNPNLAKELPPFEYAGENVGMGPSCDEIHAAFMNSRSHKAVILDPDYRAVGVGVTVDEGTVFVTLDLWTPKVFRPKAKASPKPSPRCTCK